MAFLVDPVQRSVSVFEAGRPPEVFSSPRTLVLLAGLELALDDRSSSLAI